MIDELRSEELQLKRRLAKIRLERALERRAARQLNIKWEIALGVWGTLLLVGGVAVMFGGHYSSPPPLQPITTTPTTVAPTTTPTCRIGPQTRGCTRPDGPCSYTGPCVTETIPSPPPTATGGCIEGETPQGRCLTNPDGYITALKTHGFTITDFNATITYGAKVCDLLANKNLESVVDYL
ncbi:MAG TPA: hypothetical protein VN888_00385, partial [Mycobacterium sp.]|nr:hypothetical protein [Mycobacterium sp.]